MEFHHFQFPNGFSHSHDDFDDIDDVDDVFQFPNGFSLQLKVNVHGQTLTFQFPNGFSLRNKQSDKRMGKGILSIP